MTAWSSFTGDEVAALTRGESFFLAPGERSGRFRIGGDELPMDGDQPAGISVADLAVAIVDEIEQGIKLRQRFTVSS